MARQTIKLRIPGSKQQVEVPRWAAYALGGAGILALFFLGGKRDSEGVQDGLLAADIAQALEEQRMEFGTALGTIAERVEEVAAQSELLPEAPPVKPIRKREMKPAIATQQFVPGYGQIPTGQVPFVTVEEEKKPDALKALSEAEIQRQAKAAATSALKLTRLAEEYEAGRMTTIGATPVQRRQISAAPSEVERQAKAAPSEIQRKTSAQEATERVRRAFEQKRSLLERETIAHMPVFPPPSPQQDPELKRRAAESERLRGLAAEYEAGRMTTIGATPVQQRQAKAAPSEIQRRAKAAPSDVQRKTSERAATERVRRALEQKRSLLERQTIAHKPVSPPPSPRQDSELKRRAAESERLTALAEYYRKRFGG